MFSLWVFLFVFSIVPLFMSNTLPSNILYVNIFRFLFPCIGITIGTVALIITPKGEKKDFAFVITCAIALLLGYEIFEQIYGGQSSNIYIGYWIVFWISAYFAFLAIAVKRIILDYKYLSRNTIFVGIALAPTTLAPFYDMYGITGVYVSIFIISLIFVFVITLLYRFSEDFITEGRPTSH